MEKIKKVTRISMRTVAATFHFSWWIQTITHFLKTKLNSLLVRSLDNEQIQKSNWDRYSERRRNVRFWKNTEKHSTPFIQKSWWWGGFSVITILPLCFGRRGPWLLSLNDYYTLRFCESIWFMPWILNVEKGQFGLKLAAYLLASASPRQIVKSLLYYIYL